MFRQGVRTITIRARPLQTSRLLLRKKEEPATTFGGQVISISKDPNQTEIHARPDNAFFEDVLSGGPRPPVQIDACLSGAGRSGRTGFQLSNGLQCASPVFLLNGEAFLWRPSFRSSSPPDDSTIAFEEESFGVVQAVGRKPELLILGTGRRNVMVAPETKEMVRRMGVQLDTMDTRNAASTFNVLAAEGRSVAVALLPIE